MDDPIKRQAVLDGLKGLPVIYPNEHYFLKLSHEWVDDAGHKHLLSDPILAFYKITPENYDVPREQAITIMLETIKDYFSNQRAWEAGF